MIVIPFATQRAYPEPAAAFTIPFGRLPENLFIRWDPNWVPSR